MKIPISFLGTGQAIPTAKRNHSAILLTWNDENILVDCGEGTQRQFRKLKLNPCKLTKILITHWHGDHILGLPGLLQTLALNGYNRMLDIYIPKHTSKFMEMIFSMFVFQGKINYKIHECDPGVIFEDKDIKILAERMQHGTPTLAYSFIEKEKVRIDKAKLIKTGVKGKIISQLVKGKDIIWQGKTIKADNLIYKQPGKKITFIFDTKFNPEMITLAKNSDLLISESTYLEEDAQLAKENLHLTASQAAECAKKANCKKLILTHISQRYDLKEKAIVNEARKIFKNSEIASDLMQVEV